MKKKSIKYLSIIVPVTLIGFFLCLSAVKLLRKDNQFWFEQVKNVEAHTVLLNNEKDLIPLKVLTSNKIASVNTGFAFASDFDSLANKYARVDAFSLTNYSDTSLNKLNTSLKFYQTVFIQLTEKSVQQQSVIDFIADLNQGRNVVLVMFGKATELKFLDSFAGPIISSVDGTSVSAVFAAQLIFGGVGAKAKLTEDISSRFKRGDGYQTIATRLKYTVPEELGIPTAAIEQPVDKIMAEALAAKATPGAVVMVVKDGRVIFNKAYGKHTYGGSRWDKVDDIFDVASVTKISATTIAAMRLYEQQKIVLDQKLGSYLPLSRTTNKKDLSIRELLLHEAGLTPFIPFYLKLKPYDHSTDSSSYYSVKVADGYYLRRNYYEDVMLPRMLNTALSGRGKYEYSDLSMYFMKEVIERQAMQSLDSYVDLEFYKPLGMQTAAFNPRNHFDKSRIVPTEQDNYFRKTLLEGYVHDQGASMAGGVAGHAGLFASSNDLAILFQMILNGGAYGGLQYFNPATISLFTSRQSTTSRRGLGFDRWDPETGKYPSSLASSETYGHTGYTGTCVWVDPKSKLIYIFLSNRVHPAVTDKLSSMKIRPRIQDAIYEAIKRVGS